ncbi:MAG: phage tail protein [Sphingobacteriales bacterium]|nr:MAG: phage tail protein [Sphingobacteriales bacterium]
MEPFVGEIRVFGCNYAPRGWAQCNGQLLPIRQYTALFSILGVNYGGDGKTTFALPNLQCATAIGAGKSTASGTTYDVGDQGGENSVQLISTEMPMHTHTFNGGTAAQPVNTLTNTPTANQSYISNTFAKASPTATTGVPGRSFGPSTPAANVNLNPMAVSVVGGNQAHDNMQPFVAVNYCIAIEGVFPQRP